MRYYRKCSDSQITSHFIIALFAMPVWYLLPVFCYLLYLYGSFCKYHLMLQQQLGFLMQVTGPLNLPRKGKVSWLDESRDSTFFLFVRRDDTLLRSLPFIKESHLHITSGGILLPIAINQTTWFTFSSFHELNPAAFT